MLSNTDIAEAAIDTKYNHPTLLYKKDAEVQDFSDAEKAVEDDKATPIVEPVEEKEPKKEVLDTSYEKDFELPDYQDLKFDNDTEEAVTAIAKEFKVPPQQVRYILAIESGGRANAKNANKTAVGLIQFFADNSKASYNERYKTLEHNGKKQKFYLKDIEKMSSKEQIPLVISYLKGTGLKKGADFYDMYASVFYPKSRGKGNDYILGGTQSRQNSIAKGNKHYDLDYDPNSKSNKISNREFKLGAKKAISTFYNQWKRTKKKMRKGGILYNKFK